MGEGADGLFFTEKVGRSQSRSQGFQQKNLRSVGIRDVLPICLLLKKVGFLHGFLPTLADFNSSHRPTTQVEKLVEKHGVANVHFRAVQLNLFSSNFPKHHLWVSQDVLPSSVQTSWNPLSTPGAALSTKRSAHHHHQWRQPRYLVRMHSNAQSPYAAAGKSARAPAMYDGLSSNQFFHLLQLPRRCKNLSKWETRHSGAPLSVDIFLISVAKFGCTYSKWIHFWSFIGT